MTPEEREAFLKRWSKGQTIYTPESRSHWSSGHKRVYHEPVDHDLSPEEHEALMTRPQDGWDKDDWEILEDMAWPVGGIVALCVLGILVWKFGYLLQ